MASRDDTIAKRRRSLIQPFKDRAVSFRGLFVIVGLICAYQPSAGESAVFGGHAGSIEETIVSVGKLATAHERPALLAAGETHRNLTVRAANKIQPLLSITANGTQLWVTDRNRRGPQARLYLYTTMATWCAACTSELPQFLHLRSAFKPSELSMFGLPYDAKEDPEQIKAWGATHRPPYELLADLSSEEISSIKKMVLNTLKIDGIPASIVTDGKGRVLKLRWGPPTVSELRELLWTQTKTGPK